ncbi:hypothetical protein OEZ86_000341 [Tetradesmus obliquus]|nr:hypothetical protein OEZ86_000341 [Tetradesmus obliquus]
MRAALLLFALLVLSAVCFSYADPRSDLLTSQQPSAPAAPPAAAAAAAALHGIRRLLSVSDFGPDSWAYWGGSANDRSWQSPVGGSWRSGGSWDRWDSWAGGRRRAEHTRYDRLCT